MRKIYIFFRKVRVEIVKKTLTLLLIFAILLILASCHEYEIPPNKIGVRVISMGKEYKPLMHRHHGYTAEKSVRGWP